MGDCTLLSIEEPNNKPSSATVDFWTEWSKKDMNDGIIEAIEYLRKQSKISS